MHDHQDSAAHPDWKEFERLMADSILRACSAGVYPWGDPAMSLELEGLIEGHFGDSAL